MLATRLGTPTVPWTSGIPKAGGLEAPRILESFQEVTVGLKQVLSSPDFLGWEVPRSRRPARWRPLFPRGEGVIGVGTRPL